MSSRVLTPLLLFHVAMAWSTTSETTRIFARRRSSLMTPRYGELEDELNAAFEKQQRQKQEMVPPVDGPGLALQDEAVPQEQQPAQELKDLQEAPVFDWAQLSDDELLVRLRNLFAGVWLFVSLPISAVSFPLDREPIQAIFAANFGTTIALTLLMARLYAGWSYVADRLTKDVGYYEQSGWYDGYLSVKPAEIRARDQLLYEFDVEPALNRVTRFGAIMMAASVVSFLLFRLVAPENPDIQYDENYLNALRADDAAAMREMARQQNDIGFIDRKQRPTYCNDRYYRAVSGGSGC